MASEQLTAEDHAALSRLVVEAAWRVDHGRADTLHELFTTDARLTLGPHSMAGADAIRAWGIERSAQPRATRHVCTNMRFEATGPDRARGTTVLTVYLHDGDGIGEALPFAVSDYHDEFVRVGDEWRFSARSTSAIFSRPA